MLFGQEKKNLAVLESKFQIYEDLSKEMLDKLERAVSTISDNSNRISLILERHEMRLDQSDKADRATMKLIEKIEHKTEELDNKINQLSRFRWISIGIVLAILTVLESNTFFGSLLTNQSRPAIVEVKPK